MTDRTAESDAEPQPPPAVLSSVMSYLAWDHDRLDALCERAFDARRRGVLQDASRLFLEFARGLRRHIGLEEELLFPEFERRTGISPAAGPTAVMRHEHRQIEGLLATLERAIGRTGEEAETCEKSLRGVLGEHNAKEEQVLYPATDRLLDDAERRSLVERLRAYAR